MIQLAHLLFEDAVARYNELRELDKRIENEQELIPLFIEKDERHNLAWSELRFFAQHGDFKWKHPLLQKKKSFVQLRELKKRNIKRFLEQFSQLQKNILRYKSLKNTTKSPEKKQKYAEMYQEYIEKKDFMTQILAETVQN